MSGIRLPDSPVVRISWPDEGGLALAETCRRLGLENEHDSLLAELKTLRALEKAPAPVVGIMGLLNAGKSSLVKTFLSPAGRARLPTGISKSHGTQRFAFWLPAAWRHDDAVFRAFREVLESAFGNQLEELSEDPDQAAAQYQGGGDIANAFGVPLIAFDPGLDEFGFCLLDCPDFERRHPGAPDLDPAGIRVDFIRRVSRLLSAIIILGERDKAASGIFLLPFTRDTNPDHPHHATALGLQDIPTLLLLNKINFHEESADHVARDGEVRNLMAHLGVRRVFGAYHGRLDQAEAHIPKHFLTSDHDPSLPGFFELSEDPAANTPDAVPPERLLTHHLHGLQPAALWAARRETKAREIERALESLQSRVEQRLREQQTHLHTKRDALITFIRDQIRSRDNQLAFPLLPETAATIAQAVADTAPWYAKPALWATQGIKQTLRFVQNARHLIQLQANLGDPGELAREGAKNLRKNAASEEVRTFNPAEWARLSRNQKFMPDSIGEDELTRLWTDVQTATMDTKVDLDPAQTREFAAQLWKQIPWRKKIVLGAMGPVLIIGAMASVVAAMFDGGATIFLFFSLKELLLSLGLGGTAVAATIKSGESLEAYLIRRAGIPFYQRLLRAALEAFGLPTRFDKPPVEEFANTGKFEIQFDPAARPTPAIDLSEGRVLATTNPEAWQQLRRQISTNATSGKKSTDSPS